MRRVVQAPAAALVGALLVIAATGVAAAQPRASRLPPDSEPAIAQLFDRALRPLGLHVSRASLEQPPRYAPSPTGQHLAVYALPLGAYSAADYRANLLPVARIFLPRVFQRWSGLRSFDVCQEPLPSVDANPEAPPVTQLYVTRRGASGIDWSRVTVSQLTQATAGQARARDPSVSLFVDAAALRAPAYQSPPSTG